MSSDNDLDKVLERINARISERINKTVQVFKDAIQNRKQGELLQVEIPGTLFSSSTTPCVEYWRICNILEYSIVIEFYEMFLQNGYRPELTVSNYEREVIDQYGYLRYGKFTGGNNLILTCDFGKSDNDDQARTRV